MDREFRFTEVLAVVRAQALMRGFVQRKKYKWIKQCIPKRALIAKEIFESETSYVSGLNQVVDIYLKPLTEDSKNNGKLITKDDLRTIFSELEVIASYTKVMLTRFDERVKNWHPNQKLGDCFLRIIDYLKIYSQYVNNYDKAMDALQRLQKDNKHFREFIAERENKSGVLTPIENFLIMPVQRIPRYSLLLEDLVRTTWKDHPDYESLSKSLTRMNEVAITVNEMKRDRENQNKVIQISMSLLNIKAEQKQLLLAKNRRWVREGNVTESRLQNSPTKFWLFLFNDLMLWTNAKKGKGYKFKFISELSPDRTTVDLVATPEGRIVKVVTKSDAAKEGISHPLQVFRADTDDETIAWYNDLKKLVPSVATTDGSASQLEESGSESVSASASASTSKQSKTASTSSLPAQEEKQAPKKKAPEQQTKRGYASSVRSTMKLTDLKFLEENERVRYTKIEAERQRINEWQSYDDISELSLFQVKKEEVANVYKVFSQKTYDAYGDLFQALVELNVGWESPEIVLIGRSGDGKTRLLEALLGFPLALVPLKRPLYVNLVNNKECITPRITLKKDATMKIRSDVVVTTNAQLKKELTRRAYELPGEFPVYLVFESSQVFNGTIIDTPGLELYQWGAEDAFLTTTSSSSSSGGSSSAASTPASARRMTTANKTLALSNIIYNLAKNQERLLLFVEEAKDKNVMSIASRVASVVDPNFVRSVFVYTKFQNKLRDMHTRAEVNSYFASAPKNSHTFFVSLPSNPVREAFVEDPVKFRKHVTQAYLLDLDHLDRLQYNTEYADIIGVQRLRRHLHNIFRKKYRESVPTKLDQITILQSSTEQHLAGLKRKKDYVNVTKLRALANEYVMKFVGVVNKLVEGSTDVEAGIYGQDMEDERLGLELVHPDWVDAYNQTLPLKPEKWQVPLWNCKLYGSPQIIRLFNVFTVIVQHYKIKAVKNEDIVTAIGTSRPLHNLPFFVRAALEVAKGKAEKVLSPLVEQLCERAKQMLKRLGVMAQTIIIKTTRQAQISSSSESLLKDLDMPLFAGHVRVLYEQLVEELAAECLKQCTEVINQTVIYNVEQYVEAVPEPNDEDGVQKIMATLAAKMFEDMSKQFLRSVTVKCYDILIAKGAAQIKRIIQNIVFAMNDATISELFDVNQLKENLAHEEKHLLRSQQEIAKSRAKFLAASEVFSSEEFKHVLRSLNTIKSSKRLQAKHQKTPAAAVPNTPPKKDKGKAADSAAPASSSSDLKKKPEKKSSDEATSLASKKRLEEDAAAAKKKQEDEAAAKKKQDADAAAKKHQDADAKKKQEADATAAAAAAKKKQEAEAAAAAKKQEEEAAAVAAAKRDEEAAADSRKGPAKSIGPSTAAAHAKLTSQPSAEKAQKETPIQPGKVKEALASLSTTAPIKKDAVVIEDKKVSSIRSAFEQAKDASKDGKEDPQGGK